MRINWMKLVLLTVLSLLAGGISMNGYSISLKPPKWIRERVKVGNPLEALPESVRNALSRAGEAGDFLVDGVCAAGVGGSVGGGMLCGGCIASSTASAGATAVACAKPCEATAASLVIALKTCKIKK